MIVKFKLNKNEELAWISLSDVNNKCSDQTIERWLLSVSPAEDARSDAFWAI
jgi:hypothetical protein